MESALIGLNYQTEQALADFVATTAVPSNGFPLAGAGATNLTQLCVAGYGCISGYFFADAAGTLFIQQTIDGTNFDVVTRIPVRASIAAMVDVPVFGTMARVRYVNDSVAQTLARARIVARTISGMQAGGGMLGTPGNVNSVLVIQNLTTALGAGATSDTSIIQIPNASAIGDRYTGYDLIRGFVQSDIAGQVEIYQGRASADMAAPFTNCLQSIVGYPAGGAGSAITQVVVAPFILVRQNNTGGAQARNRLWCALTGS